jgi:hypothetical protein
LTDIIKNNNTTVGTHDEIRNAAEEKREQEFVNGQIENLLSNVSTVTTFGGLVLAFTSGPTGWGSTLLTLTGAATKALGIVDMWAEEQDIENYSFSDSKLHADTYDGAGFHIMAPFNVKVPMGESADINIQANSEIKPRIPDTTRGYTENYNILQGISMDIHIPPTETPIEDFPTMLHQARIREKERDAFAKFPQPYDSDNEPEYAEYVLIPYRGGSEAGGINSLKTISHDYDDGNDCYIEEIEQTRAQELSESQLPIVPGKLGEEININRVNQAYQNEAMVGCSSSCQTERRSQGIITNKTDDTVLSDQPITLTADIEGYCDEEDELRWYDENGEFITKGESITLERSADGAETEDDLKFSVTLKWRQGYGEGQFIDEFQTEFYVLPVSASRSNEIPVDGEIVEFNSEVSSSLDFGVLWEIKDLNGETETESYRSQNLTHTAMYHSGDFLGVYDYYVAEFKTWHIFNEGSSEEEITTREASEEFLIPVLQSEPSFENDILLRGLSNHSFNIIVEGAIIPINSDSDSSDQLEESTSVETYGGERSNTASGNIGETNEAKLKFDGAVKSIDTPDSVEVLVNQEAFINARISIPSKVTAEQGATFDATGSTAPDSATYEWYIWSTEANKPDTPTDTGQTLNYTFSQDQLDSYRRDYFNIELQIVKDGNSYSPATDRVQRKVNYPGPHNEDQIEADIGVYAAANNYDGSNYATLPNAGAGARIHLDASYSRGPDDLQYEWRIYEDTENERTLVQRQTGDPTLTESIAKQWIETAETATWVFEVTVSSTNSDFEYTDTAQVKRTLSNATHLDLSTPDDLQVGREFTLDASASYGPGDLSYEWYICPSGGELPDNPQHETENPTVQHTFTEDDVADDDTPPGNVIIRVKAISSDPAVNIQEKSFSEYVAYGDDVLTRLSVPNDIVVGESVTLDASDTFNASNTDFDWYVYPTYGWRGAENERPDEPTETTTGATLDHTFESPEDYTVEVVATAPGRSTASVTRTVEWDWNTLRLTGSAGTIDEYRIVIEGDIEAKSNIESTDSITSYDSVDVVEGQLPGDDDVYRYHGEIVDISEAPTVDVLINGEAVQTSQYGIDAQLQAPDRIGVNATKTLDASATTSQDRIKPLEYRWYIGKGSIPDSPTHTTTDPMFQRRFNSTGDYKIKLEVVSQNTRATPSVKIIERTVERRPHELVIEGPGRAGESDYSVTVSGEIVEKSATGTVSLRSAIGTVSGSNTEKYQFSGAVTDFTVRGDRGATVQVNGQRHYRGDYEMTDNWNTLRVSLPTSSRYEVTVDKPDLRINQELTSEGYDLEAGEVHHELQTRWQSLDVVLEFSGGFSKLVAENAYGSDDVDLELNGKQVSPDLDSYNALGFDAYDGESPSVECSVERVSDTSAHLFGYLLHRGSFSKDRDEPVEISLKYWKQGNKSGTITQYNMGSTDTGGTFEKRITGLDPGETYVMSMNASVSYYTSAKETEEFTTFEP